MSKTVSYEWILSQLAGMKFPNDGEAHDYIKKCFEAGEIAEHCRSQGLGKPAPKDDALGQAKAILRDNGKLHPTANAMLARMKDLSDNVRTKITWPASVDMVHTARSMAGLFHELNNHIENGGALPDAWKEVSYTDHKLMTSIDYEQECIGCGKKLTPQDIDGDRCYGCGRMIHHA